MKVGRGGYDQSIVVHDFCPPEGREDGCLLCRYCPEMFRGWKKWEYKRFLKTGERPEPAKKEDYIKSGLMRPQKSPIGGPHG